MTGLLLLQLGTPDAPTAPALRRYLRQFLSDPRVIEVNRALWWAILNGVVLPFRPRFSAAKYRRIWDATTGSPLLYNTRLQGERLAERFPGVPVRFGMQYGNPSVASAVDDLVKNGVDRIVAVPMYPQYSATTTAAATDALFAALMKLRHVPAVRTVPPYYADAGYLGAMAAVVRDELARLPWTPEHIVISFHGIPQKYAQRGDPYALHCTRTGRQLAALMGWRKGYWSQAYQSLFGRDAWLRPYTDDRLAALAKAGTKRVMVVLPGFTADCLETIDEIGHESKEMFLHAGGESLHQCRCLNDHPAWIDALAGIVRAEGAGWLA